MGYHSFEISYPAVCYISSISKLQVLRQMKPTNHSSQLKQTAAFLFCTLILNSYLCWVCKHYLEIKPKASHQQKKKIYYQLKAFGLLGQLTFWTTVKVLKISLRGIRLFIVSGNSTNLTVCKTFNNHHMRKHAGISNLVCRKEINFALTALL